MTNITYTSRRAFVAGTTATFAATLSGRATAQAPKSLSVRIDRDITQIDPATRGGPSDGNVMRAVYQRLITLKTDGTGTELDAASEVKQISPTLIEFTLKPNQMFTDGYGEMTAEDVKFSFERIGLTGADGQVSIYKNDWAGLISVEVTGKYTGKINMSKPNAGLFTITLGDGSGAIVSKKAVTERGIEHGTRPVGSGPYKVVSVEKQRGAVIARNEAWTGPKPDFDEFKINFIQDSKTAELALRSGELGFGVLPPSNAEPLRTAPGLAVDEVPGLAYVWLGMNVEKAPFNDPRVREAIRLALDVDQMLLAGYNGKAPRLNSLIMTPILGVWKDAPVRKRNVAEAKKLLAEAGMTSFKTRVTVLNQPVFTTMALVARAQLQEVGITLDVDAQDGGTYWDSGKGDIGKNLDMFMMKFAGKLDPNFLMQWFVTSQIGSWNWQRWTSPEFDKLASDATAELDPAKRTAMCIEAQKLMDKSAAFVWLTNEVAFSVHKASAKPAYLPGAIDWQYAAFTGA